MKSFDNWLDSVVVFISLCLYFVQLTGADLSLKVQAKQVSYVKTLCGKEKAI